MPTINTLLCHRDVEKALLCLGSFVAACDLGTDNDETDPLRLRVFSDGSLSAEDLEVLRAQLPIETVIERAEMGARVAPLLEKHPRCRALSESSALGLKLIEMPLYCRGVLGEARFVYSDCDILYFQRLTNARDLWKRDLLLCERDVVLSGRPSRILPHAPILNDVNSGLISLPGQLVDLDFIEWFLGQDAMHTAHPFLREQTCWALLGARSANPVYLCDPREIVCNHFFAALEPQTIALHFIAGLKSRVAEFAPLGLTKASAPQAPRRELHFRRARHLTRSRALAISLGNRSGLRGRWLKHQARQQYARANAPRQQPET